MLLERLRTAGRTVSSRLRTRDPALVTPPTTTDAAGRQIRVRSYDDDLASLVALYVAFDPGQRAQGTPPVTEAAIRDWLETVVNDLSVVAWHGDRAVGHVMFAPDGDGGHELAIFVHRDYQRAGVGSTLLRAGLGHARAQGVTRVWLSVEATRPGLQKLYREFGFRTDVPGRTTHRMSRRL